MIQLLITLALLIALNIVPALLPKPEPTINPVLVPFLEALKDDGIPQRPPDVIPPFPDLFHDFVPWILGDEEG